MDLRINKVKHELIHLIDQSEDENLLESLLDQFKSEFDIANIPDKDPLTPERYIQLVQASENSRKSGLGIPHGEILKKYGRS